MRNQRGQSLVQVLVSVAIMGILMAVMTTLQSNQSRSNQALGEKLGALDLQKQLIYVMTNPGLCMSYLGAGATFDATALTSSSPPVINLPNVLRVGTKSTDAVLSTVGAAASPLTNSLVVASHQLTGIAGDPAGNSFTGMVVVNFNQSRLVMPIHPASVQVTLATDSSSPANAKRITDCNGPPVPPSSSAGTVCGSRFVTCDPFAVPVYYGNGTCEGSTLTATCTRDFMSDRTMIGSVSGCPSGYTTTLAPAELLVTADGKFDKVSSGNIICVKN